ncbi:heterokaryon incompatibility protein het-E-1 [Fusarium sp. NRRL 52700]|nr:heterokaryon incompatibility protein het-E-1 [Fusarium sp. NRRL 52700]
MASSEASQSWLPKRQRADSGDSARSLQYDDYTVGWISALPLEMTAVQAMLDHRHEPLRQHPQDSNCYEFGSINGHNVAIACLPKAQYGNNNAAIVANNMHRTFPHLQQRLLVGIAGGAPGSVDVRLGDVVVSTHAIQYDLGKAMPDNHFQHIAEAIRPPQALMAAVSKVEARHNGGQVQMLEVLSEATVRLPHYGHPMVEDCLFHSELTHTSSGTNCDSCDRTQLVSRDIRPNADPVVHYGRVASGNQVIRDALTRDYLSKKINNICFEMEAAGVMDCFPCLVIRGVCDYSDSHKNKGWQEYASLVAAAFAKELLISIPPQLLRPQKRARTQQPKASEPTSPGADECLRAMFVTDASLDREGILDAKGDICEGTCDWILSTEEFQAWDQNPPHLLWISAPPGMGKTFMSIYLSKHLEAISKKASGVATIFFFSDNKDESRNTAVGILRSLMYQLISYEPGLINSVIPQWKQQSQRLFHETSFGTLWNLFDGIIAQSDLKTIYCVIDALDECEASSLSLLLRKFERLSRGHANKSPKLRLVCLSRRYPENIPEALLLFTKMEVDTMTARKEDISRFISSQVHELTLKKKLSRKMRLNLEETFKNKSEGTFLWISLMSQDLQKKGLLDFEASLDMLPAGLDAVYERILKNIEFEKRRIIHDILYWILVATRPLTIGKHNGISVPWTVTFLHQSAKDYLIKLDLPFGSQVPGLTHNQLHEHATIFLIHIADDFPLASYATMQWEFHFRELEDITRVMQKGLSFFEEYSEVRHMWENLYHLEETGYHSKTIPLLHLAAFLALDSLAEWCLRHDGENDIETKWGFSANTALVTACERNQEYIISLLLDAGADPIADMYVAGALGAALRHFNRRILQLMARTDSCKNFLIDSASNKDGSLIHTAATFGNEDACRFLIEDFGWDLNWESGNVGSEALSCALLSGNPELISCFIKEWHVPIKNDSKALKETCTSSASEIDFEQIIRLLVDHCSVDINATDIKGQNTLCFAFKYRNRWFSALPNTRVLLHFGCSPDQTDHLGRTTMHCHTKQSLQTYRDDFKDTMELLVRNSQEVANSVKS